MKDRSCKVREELKVVAARFEADLNIATVTFDQDVQWDAGLSQSDYSLKILSNGEDEIKAVFSPDSTRPVSDLSGLSPSQSAEFGGPEIRGNTLRIPMKFKDTVRSGVLVLILPGKYKIQKKDDPSVALYIRVITVSPIDYILTDADKTMEGAQKSVSTAVTIVTTLLLVLSIPQALVLMKVFQTIDYYIYIDCDYPTNFSKFLEMISKNPLEMLPNIFKFLSDNEGKPVYNRFEMFGLQIHFLLNVGVQISLIILLALIKLALYCLHKLFPKVKFIKSKHLSLRTLFDDKPTSLLQLG